MKRFILVWCTGLIIFSDFFSTPILFAQKYFKAVPVYSDSIRLTILNPSLKRIRTIQKLRERGLITLDKLRVIGVFHEKERTDYNEAKQYSKDHKLNWMKFHRLCGPLNKTIIFRKNSYTWDFQDIFHKSDGIILFGGPDIPPDIYNHKINPFTLVTDPNRHYLEISLTFHLLGGSENPDGIPLLQENPDFPIIGFCLGAQTLNVATGGTMVQDIWTEVYKIQSVEKVLLLYPQKWHKNPYAQLYPEKEFVFYQLHKIRLCPQGKFISEFGFSEQVTPLVLSGHHQMIDTLGKNLQIIATSWDGKVPEAIEHMKYPHVLGVQFHPEYGMLWDPNHSVCFSPSDSVRKSLFSILEENPPSLEFHKKLWSWFEESLVKYHSGRFSSPKDRN